MTKTIFISASIIIASVAIFTACKTKVNEEDKTPTVLESVKTIDSAVKEVTDSKLDVKTTVAKTNKKDSTKNKAKDTANKIPLTVNVTNLESRTGTVVIGVYGKNNKFLDEKDEIKEYRFKPKNGKLSVKISDLEFGEFGMAIYQDVDGDGKITKNLIGVPKEPYAFSNNYKPTVKAPSFDDCKFQYSAKANTVNMKLIK